MSRTQKNEAVEMHFRNVLSCGRAKVIEALEVIQHAAGVLGTDDVFGLLHAANTVLNAAKQMMDDADEARVKKGAAA